ncbi:MAG: glycosyltransferase family 39 protein, partial [Ardenticatenaceae bacterium]
MDRFQRVLLVAMVGTLLAAFALRLQQLGAQSLWYDETISAHLAAQSLGALIAHTARDIHPPLYY